VLIYGNRKTLFRFILTDDVFVEKSFNFCGFGSAERTVAASAARRRYYLVADVDAFISKINARTAISFLTSF
jgi:hypothetical protein